MQDPDQPQATHIREASVGFDWAAVEDPVGIVLEELGPGFTRVQAERVWRWHIHRGRADQAGELTLNERVMLWIGGADEDRGDLRALRRPDRAQADDTPLVERRIGVRAAVAVKELSKFSRMGRLSYKTLAKIFRCSHGEIWRVAQNFRASVPQETKKEN
jgi:hypothetical protein